MPPAIAVSQARRQPESHKRSPPAKSGNSASRGGKLQKIGRECAERKYLNTGVGWGAVNNVSTAVRKFDNNELVIEGHRTGYPKS